LLDSYFQEGAERTEARSGAAQRPLTSAGVVTRGLLLPEDAAVIVQEAASSKLFATTVENAEPC
jgi:hypothetical protein